MGRLSNKSSHFVKQIFNQNHKSLPEKFQQCFFSKRSQMREVVIARSFTERFQSYSGENLHCWQVIWLLSSSLLRGIFPWILLCGGYGLLVSHFNHFGWLASLSQLTALPQIVITLNIILSLLLAFRTNTAHQRFWEGRKLWGSMVNTVRNLSRDIWVVIQERELKDRDEKEATVKLVAAFSIATKLHLRRESVNFELVPLISPWQYRRLREANHPPLEIAFWIGDYLQQQYEDQKVNVFQLTALQKQLDEMVDILGGCERILKTPVPLMYSIMLNTLLLIYFLLLPLGLVGQLTWLTAPVVAFISFLIFSINEIGAEIEQPFGHDPNDLPLDLICQTILGNVEELLSFDPSNRFPLRKIRKLKNYISQTNSKVQNYLNFGNKSKNTNKLLARIIPWWKTSSL